MITDRGLVVGVIAPRLDPEAILVGEVMNPMLLTAEEEEEDDVDDTVQRMGEHGVRRLPVVDTEGRLVGIVSQDDLLSHLTQELAALALVSRQQQATESIVRT